MQSKARIYLKPLYHATKYMMNVETLENSMSLFNKKQTLALRLKKTHKQCRMKRKSKS